MGGTVDQASHSLSLPAFLCNRSERRRRLGIKTELRMHGHSDLFLFPHFGGKPLFLKSDKFGVGPDTFFPPSEEFFSLLSCLLCSPPFCPTASRKEGKGKLGRSLEKEVFLQPYPTLLREERPWNPNAWPAVMVLCALC